MQSVAHRQEPPAATSSTRTTIDAALQEQVEIIVGQRLVALRGKNVGHAAVVVLDNATGEVLALVGSRDFQSADGGQINGAWVPHSPGSALSHSPIYWRWSVDSPQRASWRICPSNTRRRAAPINRKTTLCALTGVAAPCAGQFAEHFRRESAA